MTPSEVGTKYPDLIDIVEREGIDLSKILEQWKSQGIDNVPAGGRKIQRAQMHTWGDRTPMSQSRERTTTTLTQEDEKEKRKEIK